MNRRLFWIGLLVLIVGCQLLTNTPSPTPFQSITPVPSKNPAPSSAQGSAVPAGWLTYADSAAGLSFAYPPGGQLSHPEEFDIRLDLPFAPGTNLVEKYLEVGIRQGVEPCGSPHTAGLDPSHVQGQVVEINEQAWQQESGGGVGLGNIYEYTAYSRLLHGACISLTFILHSTNPGNYATPPPLFDQEGEAAVFGRIMDTVSFAR